MRVAFFTEAGAWGGTEVHTLAIIEAVAAAGHDVVHLQIGHDLYRTAGPAPVGRYATVTVPLREGNFRTPGLRWWLALLRRYRPDVCVLSKGGFDLRSRAFDAAVRLVARRYVVLEMHPAPLLPARGEPKRYLAGLVRGLSLWWWRRHWRAYASGRLHTAASHRVVTDSQHVSDILHAQYDLHPGKTFLVPPGVDTAEFRFRPAARAELRARWGVPADALVLGSVGRLEPEKGLDRAVRAFAAVRAACGEDLWLVLAGRGGEAAALAALAAEYGVADRVLLPGYVAHAADALSALDVYLMPSREEGFGIALIEAMACERPSVAMNSGGPAEILTAPDVGWLTPADDEAAFTAAVAEAVGLGCGGRCAVGQRARAHVEQHFARGRQARRIAELITGA